MPGDHRQARILAMQALCQWDVQGDEAREALERFLTSQEASDAAGEYATELAKSFWAQRQGVDDRIAAAATNWGLSRMSPVERNVMRVAVVELLAGKVPAKVALNEAIEIGREYGGKESPRFMNGVLDMILKRVKRIRKDNG